MSEAEVEDGTSNTIDVEADDVTQAAPEDSNAGELIAAALLGAAVGAGLGLLATRLVDADDMRASLAGARREMRRGMSRGLSAARRSVGAASALKGYADQAREVFEDALAREVRELRRAARRRRRKLGF